MTIHQRERMIKENKEKKSDERHTHISFFFPFCFVILLTLTSQCVVLLILNSFYDDAANNLQSLYVRPVDGRPMFRGRPVRPIDSSRISFRREELRKRAAGLSL